MSEVPAFLPRDGAPIVDVDAPDSVAVDASTLRDWIEQGRLPVHQVPPPRERPREDEPEPHMWALADDIRSVMADDPLEPPPEPHDDLHHVYVIELEGCQKAAHRRGRCVYVGQSWYPPRARFIQHLVGYNEGRGHVTRWGIRLRPDLYSHVRASDDRDVIEARERQTAEQLAERFDIHGVNLE